VKVRPANASDAAAIAAVCNEIGRELYDVNDVDETTVHSWLELPNVGAFVAEADERIRGYGDVQCEAEGSRFSIDVRARGGGAAAALAEAAERWSRERAQPGALARGYIPDRDREATAAFEDAGYRPARHTFVLQIELGDEPEQPRWPDGITVRTFDAEADEQRLYECHQEAFSDHHDFHREPLEAWRRFNIEQPRFDSSLWWLAEDGGELAGFSLGAWHNSGDPTFGWIGNLGVRRPWRRRGLGLGLLRQSFADFAGRGADRVGLGVDAQNSTGAVELYEKAGMHVLKRHVVYEKELTP
jgi:mycothiol synthase